MIILVFLLPSFTEPFKYVGPHAASHHTMSTVWWSQNWDVTQDSAFLAQVGGGHHVDIHKADTPFLSDGSLTSSGNVKGGDGSPGVGVHHVDYHGVVSSRLRIPVTRPTHISFYAPKDVTTAHWWEIVFTPYIIGAENTAIPSQQSVIPALPRRGIFSAMGSVPGPGRTPYEPSVNIIYSGRSDIPCLVGFEGRLAVRDASSGADAITHSSYFPHDISYSSDVLWHFYVDVDEDIVIHIDKNDDGIIDFSESFEVEVPWDFFYVHLTSVAYQADHHPQGDCFTPSLVREIKWRNFFVDHTIYEGVEVWPKEAFGERELIAMGTQAFDFRDSQRRGEGPFGLQPNKGLLKNSNGILCKTSAWKCSGKSEKTFDVAMDRESYPKSIFVYSIKGVCEAYINVNGVKIKLDDASSVKNNGGGWVRRGSEIFGLSKKNKIKISKNGPCFIDDISIEAYF